MIPAISTSAPMPNRNTIENAMLHLLYYGCTNCIRCLSTVSIAWLDFPVNRKFGSLEISSKVTCHRIFTCFCRCFADFFAFFPLHWGFYVIYLLSTRIVQKHPDASFRGLSPARGAVSRKHFLKGGNIHAA